LALTHRRLTSLAAIDVAGERKAPFRWVFAKELDPPYLNYRL
jgi:hypothetical protein